MFHMFRLCWVQRTSTRFIQSGTKVVALDSRLNTVCGLEGFRLVL